MENNKPENGLKRKLGLFPFSNIVIANMIGAGIFTNILSCPRVSLPVWPRPDYDIKWGIKV
jgi:amino acid transporter